ncbi:hypothetical protein PI124_g20363 [Phytophthora idaei]|nr:hypothetical protein PI126_g20304 [Phytophthora idaei]KAG3234583.1 hypothetical protein PI124_g20363 [Phytophthora idaei]
MDKVNKIQGTTEIPARVCLSESANGQTLNVNTDSSDGLTLQPHKAIFVNSKRGRVEDDDTKA